MPPKKKSSMDSKKPKPKPKQKQKQKQIVKQNVKVNVQSSGGSGGGGTQSPNYPQSSENVYILNALGQIAESLKRKASAPIANAFSSTPANDSETVKSVFNAPINTNKPVELGLSTEHPSTKKKERITIYESEGSPTPSEAYYSPRAPRKDIGKSRGSYKEKAIIEGRNVQNIFALGGQTGGGSSLLQEVMSGGAGAEKTEIPVMSGFEREPFEV